MSIRWRCGAPTAIVYSETSLKTPSRRSRRMRKSIFTKAFEQKSSSDMLENYATVVQVRNIFGGNLCQCEIFDQNFIVDDQDARQTSKYFPLPI